MKESVLIQMKNRIENMEKVVVAILLRLEKLEGVEENNGE